MLAGCIEDGFETSPSSQPRFSVDTLDMGVQFAGRPSPTYAFTIHNPHSRQLCLSSVRLRSGEHFRINVDGMSAREFSDVEIRAKDSVYVFVEGTFPPSGLLGAQMVNDMIDVVTNGVTSSVVVAARCVDAVELDGMTVGEDMRLTADRPYLVSDTLRVSRGATLTIAAGASLLFHDKAALVVEGTLCAEGTADAPVTMRGDRTGNVVADISFEVMSNQWEGVRFAEESAGNRLTHTQIINTCQGLMLDSLSDLTMINCRITNSGSVLVEARAATLTVVGSELSNARDALALLHSGSFLFDRCTLANWYLFAYPSLAIVEMTQPDSIASFESVNSIIYGRGVPVGFGVDDPESLLEMPIRFRRCMFAVAGEDDANFVDCIWEEDPALDYSLTDYVFEYVPMPESPAIGAADSSLDSPLLPVTDFRGRRREDTLGAYAPVDNLSN